MSLQEEIESTPWWRTRVFIAAVALLAIVAVAAAWWLSRPKHFSTAPGGLERVVLSDYSLLELNADSAVDVDYGFAKRGAALLRGEVGFRVSADSKRPFVLTAGRYAVRTSGGRFTVRRLAQSIEVVIVQGPVFVALADDLDHSGSWLAPSIPKIESSYFATFGPEGLKLRGLSDEELDEKLRWRGGNPGAVTVARRARSSASEPLPFSPLNPASTGSAQSGYLIDTRGFDAPMAALQLEWPEDVEEFTGRADVAAGNGGERWHAVVTGAPIANLALDGGKLRERRIELPALHAPYLRLTWAGAVPPFELTGIRAERAEGTPAGPRTEVAVQGKPVAGDPVSVAFDLGAAHPVDRINFELPGRNAIVCIQISSRDETGQDWKPVIESGFYRLETRNGEMRNGPVAIAVTPSRYWLAKVTSRGIEPVNGGALRLTAGWVTGK